MLTRELVRRTIGKAVVSVQNPVRLDDHNQPQPDFALLRPRPDDYRGAMPEPVPRPEGYAHVRTASRSGLPSPELLPGAQVPAALLFG